MKPKLYIVTGISGSGKTTVARELIRHGELALDSKTEPEIYHFVDSNGRVAPRVRLDDLAWRQQFRWTLNEELLDTLLKQNEDRQRVFLCGRANIFQYWHKAEKVFLLNVDAKTLLSRLNSETRDNLFAKDKATQLDLISQLDTVQEKIASKGAVVINANHPVENVVDQILEQAQ